MIMSNKPFIGEYKGSPVISLPLDNTNTFFFSFGVVKARIIINYMKEIKDFVKKYEKQKGKKSK